MQSISPTKQRQGSLVTGRPRLINTEHAQSVEVIVGVVMGQIVVRLKPDRPYHLLRQWYMILFVNVMFEYESFDD